MKDEQRAREERAREIAGYLDGLARVYRDFPDASLWGHPSQAKYAADVTDEAAAMLLAFAAQPATPAEGEDCAEFERGKDEGADYVLSSLAELCGLERWERKDGSETWDGDVWATLFGILEDARVVDPWDNSIAKHAVLHEERATQPTTDPVSREEDLTDRFWLIVHEPGMVPDRKGPWKLAETAKVLREFMAANPTAFIDYLTVGHDGTPDIEHGPMVLQYTDGRSMSVGRKHNARVEASLRALPAPVASQGVGESKAVTAWMKRAIEFVDRCDSDVADYRDQGMHADAEHLLIDGYALFGLEPEAACIATLEHQELSTPAPMTSVDLRADMRHAVDELHNLHFNVAGPRTFAAIETLDRVAAVLSPPSSPVDGEKG